VSWTSLYKAQVAWIQSRQRRRESVPSSSMFGIITCSASCTYRAIGIHSPVAPELATARTLFSCHMASGWARSIIFLNPGVCRRLRSRSVTRLLWSILNCPIIVVTDKARATVHVIGHDTWPVLSNLSQTMQEWWKAVGWVAQLRELRRLTGPCLQNSLTVLNANHPNLQEKKLKKRLGQHIALGA